MDTVYGTGVTADELKGLDRDAIVQEFLDDALDAYAEREKEVDAIEEGLMRDLERFIVLQVVDIRWREHLENMDYMREGIRLRGMAQKDPLVEYRNEGAMMFQELNRADPRRGRDAALPRRGDRAGRAPSCSSRPNGANGGAELRAPVARRRRRDPRRRRHVDRGRRVASGGGGRDAGRAEAEGEQRARERRPERPLPVRLRQEVQEVPRRLTQRPEPALADDAIRLEPLAEALVPELGWVLDGDADTGRFTRIPVEPGRGVPDGWLGRYEHGWDDGILRRVRDPRHGDRRGVGFAGIRAARPREAGRVRSATSSLRRPADAAPPDGASAS